MTKWLSFWPPKNVTSEQRCLLSFCHSVDLSLADTFIDKSGELYFLRTVLALALYQKSICLLQNDSALFLCNAGLGPAEAASLPDLLHLSLSTTNHLPLPWTDKPYADADLQGSSSDSEDELMGQYQEAVSRSQGLRGGAKAATNTKLAGGFSWESRQKYSPLTADYEGYSSEASADDGRICICETRVLLCWYSFVDGAVAAFFCASRPLHNHFDTLVTFPRTSTKDASTVQWEVSLV